MFVLAGCDALLPNKTAEDKLARDKLDFATEKALGNDPYERHYNVDPTAPPRSPLAHPDD